MRQSIFIFFFFIPFLASGQGIQFSDSDWEGLKKEALESNKLIFVDAFTTWCGPCKWMAANVFPNEAVGNYFNEHFVNAKIDMEKGEGPEIANRYNVRAYPTFLFVNGQGELIHVGIGSRQPDEFIGLGQAARDPEKQFGTLRARFEEGERTPDLLRNYAAAAYEAGDQSYSEVVKAYLETQDDWTTEPNLQFIYSYFPQSDQDPVFDFAVNNRAAFYEFVEEDMVDKMIRNVIFRSSLRGEDKNVAIVEKKLVQIFGAKKGKKYFAEYKMSFYAGTRQENWEAYASAAAGYLDNYLKEMTDWNFLNQVAWNFYQGTSDSKQLKQATKWARKSIELESNYFNNDTLAFLYFKLGEMDEAKNYARSAIEIAKKNGMGFEETQKLLDQLNSLH